MRGPQRTGSWIRVALLIAAIGFGVAAVSRDLAGFLEALSTIGGWRAAASTIIVAVSLVLASEAWRESIAAVAGPLARRDAQHIFFVTQLGKYLPGSVWTVVGQVDRAREHGLSRAHMAVGALLFIGFHVVSGTVVAALVMPFAAPQVIAEHPWALLGVPLALVGILPSALRWIVNLALRLMRRDPLPTPLTGRTIARAMMWLVPMWLGFGLATAVVASPLLASGSQGRLVAASVGAFALAHVVGVVLVPLPAGVGAREVVLAVVLAPMIGLTGAASVAVVLRVLHTASDLALAGLMRRGRARRDVGQRSS